MGTIRLKEADYDDAFSTCWKELKNEFFKCETLQAYNEESERELLDLFYSGQYDQVKQLLKADVEDPNSIWNDVRERGLSFLRVHVFQRPLSEYLRFEIEAYKIQAEKGEDVRMVSLDQLQEELPEGIRDFMLFDGKKALTPEFSEDNKLVSATLSDDHEVLQPLLRQRETLLRISMPLLEFLQSTPI